MNSAEDSSETKLDSNTPVVLVTEPVSNEHLSSRRRRQQVSQACQHCRKRKIKCDESRPTCRPCAKGRLTCGYELPLGQTRIQALLESQHRLREELKSHASLLHTLRCIDSTTSVQLLGCLRRGDYDGALLSTGTPSRVTAFGDRVYPWEDALYGTQTHQELHTDMPPLINTLLPTHDGGLRHPILQSVVGNPGFPQGHDPGFRASKDATLSPWAQPLGSQSIRLRTKIDMMPSYDQKDHIYHRLDLY